MLPGMTARVDRSPVAASVRNMPRSPCRNALVLLPGAGRTTARSDRPLRRSDRRSAPVEEVRRCPASCGRACDPTGGPLSLRGSPHVSRMGVTASADTQASRCARIRIPPRQYASRFPTSPVRGPELGCTTRGVGPTERGGGSAFLKTSAKSALARPGGAERYPGCVGHCACMASVI